MGQSWGSLKQARYLSLYFIWSRIDPKGSHREARASADGVYGVSLIVYCLVAQKNYLVLSSCTGSQEPIQKTKQYTTAKQCLLNKERTMVIPLWTGKPGQNQLSWARCSLSSKMWLKNKLEYVSSRYLELICPAFLLMTCINLLTTSCMRYLSVTVERNIVVGLICSSWWRCRSQATIFSIHV